MLRVYSVSEPREDDNPVTYTHLATERLRLRPENLLHWKGTVSGCLHTAVAYLEMETHACSIPANDTLCVFYREKATHALGSRYCIPIQTKNCIPPAWPMIVLQRWMKRYWSRTWGHCTLVLLVIVPTDDDDSYCCMAVPSFSGVLLDCSS